jgi:hypothetical protein
VTPRDPSGLCHGEADNYRDKGGQIC